MYPPDMCMRQIALELVRDPYKYYPLVEEDLMESGQSYASYCYNTFHQQIWGDDLMAAILGKLWNISITIVTPKYTAPLHLFHVNPMPDVVIVSNGGSWLEQEGQKTTHFSGTESTDVNWITVGSGLSNLTPDVLNDAVKAKRLATAKFLKDQEDHTLDALRGVVSAINRMENKAAEMIEEAESLRDQLGRAEYLLQELGIRAEKIREVKAELKDKPFMRTEERERIDNDRKRKHEQDELEKEEERKRTKTYGITPEGEHIITVGHDEIKQLVSDFATPKVTPKATDPPETSQKESVTPKATVLPEPKATDLPETIQKEVVEKSTEKGVQEIVKTEKKVTPEEAVLLDFDAEEEGDNTLMWGADVEDSVLKEQEMLLLDNPTGVLPQTIPQLITQTEPPKPKRQSRLHEYLPPSTMKVINRLQAQTQAPERKNIIIIDSSQQQQQQQQQQLIQSTQLQPTQYLQESQYVPAQLQSTQYVQVPQVHSSQYVQGAQLHQVQNLAPQILQVRQAASASSMSTSQEVVIPRKGVSSLRTDTSGPIDKRLQDPKRHYCKKCKAHYTRKDELTYHERFNCLKSRRDFICEECNAGYYSDTTLMQHYFKEHLKTFLYFCQKCGQGFYYKPYRSTHRAACPNKDGPDKYEGTTKALTPELKKKFRRRTQMQVNVPPGVMAIAQEQELIDSGEVDIYEEEVPEGVTQSTSTRPTVKSETFILPTEQQEDEAFIPPSALEHADKMKEKQ